ncbi:CAMK family protein kinase [Trichomonas vaginalis G3]|uniref:CAMK family protein kinase n=1 Tax=Trichomonas vaginalis (strain ATCC PRA-98 / G3) TaxID=412133 RepID=A2FDK2_TRIV3|nr:protein serine/threonine kinase protein [Trichomonas vaginalis G3]EAX97031.1 CAMK family protein kinase [Trichomonas vaginalis G3]KAI5521951.1 protein serine/threonine kinase protein [Trichomonas vaginalis G3]|eukprot:XP_001309961.1 CAMK family protein kinase [Trichomonas vaginalis G3]
MKSTNKEQMQVYHKIHDYVVGVEIARGAFSSIREAFRTDSPGSYAMKLISKKKIRQYITSKEMIFSDSVIAPLLFHPNIARVYQTIESVAQHFQIMDLFQKNTLLYYIQYNSLTTEQLLTYLDQILSAIEYLHLHDLCHRDIKPENILMTDGNEVKLTDFGFLTFSFDGKNSGTCGSPGYAAPEVFLFNVYDGKKADIWSIGVLVYSLFAGTCPFPSDLKQSPHIYLDQVDFTKIPDCVQSFVKDCLKLDPNERPTVSQLREYTCFDSIKRAQKNERPDLISPILKPQFYAPTKLSQYLSIPQTEILASLQQKGSSPEKILYSLQSELPFLPFPRLSSCPSPGRLPNILNDVFCEGSYKILSAISSHLLPMRFCISQQPQGELRAVLNTNGEDICFDIELFDMPGKNLCDVKIKAGKTAAAYAAELRKFLTDNFNVEKF